MHADFIPPEGAPSLSGRPGPRRPLWQRILRFPETRTGWWSVGFAGGFYVFNFLYRALAASTGGGGSTFFSHPLPALCVLAAAGCAIAGAATAAWAIARKGDRSLLLLITLLLGLFVLLFALGELKGHN
jgi:hypothetical protein